MIIIIVWQSLKLPFLKEWLVFTQYITLLSLSHKWGIFIYLLIHVGTFIFVVEFVESVAKENSRPINWIEIVLIIWPDYFLDHIKIAELGVADTRWCRCHIWYVSVPLYSAPAPPAQVFTEIISKCWFSLWISRRSWCYNTIGPECPCSSGTFLF